MCILTSPKNRTKLLVLILPLEYSLPAMPLLNGDVFFIFPAAVGVQSEREEGEAFEQVDEDIAVSQSQKKFICPITQVGMLESDRKYLS